MARAYHYHTFTVLRIEVPTPPGEKQKKTFRPVHEVELSDGRKALRLGYPPGDALRPLFYRNELESAADVSLAVVVAGEKCVEAAEALGLTATCNAGGERAIKKTDWSPLARFQSVVVAIDNDSTGVAFGNSISRTAKRLGVPSVKTLQLPRRAVRQGRPIARASAEGRYRRVDPSRGHQGRVSADRRRNAGMDAD